MKHKTLKAENSSPPAIDAIDEKPVNVSNEVKQEESEETMNIEEQLRQRIRKYLRENDEAANKESTGIVPYEDISKTIAIDVAARTKEEVLAGHYDYKDKTPKDPSVSFVKQYVDKVGFKIQYMREMDSRRVPDGATELEAFLEEMVEEYIDLLLSSGVLTPEDVNELQQNPDLVAESPNFRRFLGGKISSLPESWPDTTMPSFTDWITSSYSEHVEQNKADTIAKNQRKITGKSDT